MNTANPYSFIREPSRGKKLLSLCCGIGLEFKGIHTEDVTAVDIVPEYLAEVNKKYPFVKTVLSDVVDFLKTQEDNSYDVISILDGIEHLSKKRGKILIDEMKRVCKEQIILFTPDGFSKNEPHHAWGIEAGDKHQRHLSGWAEDELTDLGFQYLEGWYFHSPHNVQYRAIMMRYVKDQDV